MAAQGSNSYDDPGFSLHAQSALYPPVSLVGRLQPEIAGADARHLRQDIRLARRLLLAQNLDEALAVLVRVELSLRRLPALEARRMACDIETLRALAAMFCDDAPRALHLARNVLQAKDPAPWSAEAARIVCQFAFWRLRDFEGLHGVPRQPAAARRYRLAAIVGWCIDGSIELEQLRLSVAKRLALRALEETETACGSGSVLSAVPASLAAQVLYEQGALEEAEALVRAHLPAISACGNLESASRVYRLLARVAARRGQMEIAIAHLQEAEQLGERRGWAGLAAMSLYERTRLLLSQGEPEQARLSCERLEQMSGRSFIRSQSAWPDVRRYCRMAQARLSLAAGPTAQTVSALRQLHDEALSGRDLFCAAQLALEVAGALERLGQHEEADQLFLRTLSLGSFAGLHQTFVDARLLIGPLLQRAYERSQLPGSPCRHLLPYIGGLLEQKPRAPAQRPLARDMPPPPVPAGRAARTPEGLSAREFDVLMLVCRGLSNKRVALTLAISPETVKAYVKRIFMKLKVESRAQAVYRASSLGLLRGTDGH
ncbi:MAG: LuxR C-terminal-related transcriptional regulator [Pseudomonadota bacterium]